MSIWINFKYTLLAVILFINLIMKKKKKKKHINIF